MAATQVGVRALRENLSSLLERVQAGEMLEVTEHGRPIARITPILDPTDVRERLIAEGHLAPARGSLDGILPVRGKADVRQSKAIRDALEEQRGDKV